MIRVFNHPECQQINFTYVYLNDNLQTPMGAKVPGPRLMTQPPINIFKVINHPCVMKLPNVLDRLGHIFRDAIREVVHIG